MGERQIDRTVAIFILFSSLIIKASLRLAWAVLAFVENGAVEFFLVSDFTIFLEAPDANFCRRVAKETCVLVVAFISLSHILTHQKFLWEALIFEHAEKITNEVLVCLTVFDDESLLLTMTLRRCVANRSIRTMRGNTFAAFNLNFAHKFIDWKS